MFAFEVFLWNGLRHTQSIGLMDKVSASGAGDSRFESQLEAKNEYNAQQLSINCNKCTSSLGTGQDMHIN